MTRRRCTTWLALAGAILACAGGSDLARGQGAKPAGAGQGPPPANVRVEPVRREQVVQRRLVIGRVEPARRSLLTGEEAGLVVAAPPEPGLAVKRDAVLARVDDKLLKLQAKAAEASVREAEAAVAERRALLELAVRNRKNLQGLFDSNVAKRKELDDAISEESAVQARLALATAVLQRGQAQRDELKERLNKTVIRAPFDAFIVRKQTELGQWLAAGDPVVELVEISRVKVRLDVPQGMIDAVAGDEPITLHIDALRTDRTTKLFSIVPDADPQSRTFDVLLKLDNADGRLKPGMSVSAQVPTGTRVAALTVPRDAVRTTPVGHTVFANRGGRAVAVPVTVRYGVGDRFVVADGGLREGEQVVVEGNERLFSGQPLKVIPATPPAAASRPADR
ncbi:MAG: efflux RND transporter periplasmic adaptor subunit [Phycisphaerae bacterium]|nr:efflux RND transporter periplasmic adaptor subunit [Phycisphaerae bacterium]